MPDRGGETGPNSRAPLELNYEDPLQARVAPSLRNVVSRGQNVPTHTEYQPRGLDTIPVSRPADTTVGTRQSRKRATHYRVTVVAATVTGLATDQTCPMAAMCESPVTLRHGKLAPVTVSKEACSHYYSKFGLAGSAGAVSTVD